MKVAQPASSPAPKTSASPEAGAATKVKGTRINAPKAADSPAVSAASSPEISTQAKDMAKAKSVAASAPEVREERIAELKRRIESGEYKVNAEAVADKMVDDHLAAMPRR